MKGFGPLLLAVLATVSANASPGGADRMGKLPLRFEECGDCDSRQGVRYLAHGPNFTLSLAPAESWLDWADPSTRQRSSIRTRLVGANRSAQMEAGDRLPGSANYLLGARAEWHTDVTGYGRVRSHEVYPAIDVVFHGEERRLEYDFIVAPGGNPGTIRMEVGGQQTLRIDSAGDLIIATSNGVVRWKRPEMFQIANGVKTPVAGRFVLAKRNTVSFEVGGYDHSRELIIDPALSYLSYLGGSGNDSARGIAVDGAGNVYVAGNTTSINLPVASALQPNFGGMTASFGGGDGFIAKFSSAGALIYLTYLGGSGDDGVSAIAVDAAGNAYVTGATSSSDFPTVNAFQSRFGGFGGNGYYRTGDAFIAKLNPAGNQLVYSTYFGGNRDDLGTAITVDSSGNAYVAGGTQSSNFPTTQGAFQTSLRGIGGEPIRPSTGATYIDPGDAFVTKLNPTGQPVFTTLVGGSADDLALTIAVDASGNIYIGGFTLSFDFPTSSGALQRVFGGSEEQNFFFITGDAFVSKLNPSGSALVYSTYFGGVGDELVSGIALDSTGNVYMTGFTTTTNLRTTTGAFQSRYAGYTALPFLIEQFYGDAFVAKLNPAGTAFVYLTYLGGSTNDAGTSIAVDGSGNAYVVGSTDSPDFPVAGGPLQSTLAGDGGQGEYILYGDAFLAVVNPAGTALSYSTYLGGNLDDIAFGVALNGAGTAYIVGNTVSVNLKASASAIQKAYSGARNAGGFIRGDAFYAVVAGLSQSGPSITQVVNAFGDSPSIAPNTWVAIKGTGLGPTQSRIWQDPDFVNSRMPTSLDGVSVKMNGTNAYVYYISPTQLNVLTPPDLASGTVQVQVTYNGVTSAVFNAPAQIYSPSLFVFNGGPYIIATHLTGNLIGPPSLFPGLTTPAKPGEQIVLYANGFGETSVRIVSGSVAQSGTLGTTPVIRVNGIQANVRFAGLISPGLFQFNVDLPSTLSDGDNQITVNFNGLNTQAGTLVTIAH